MPKLGHFWSGLCAGLLSLAAGAGCQDRPSAPALDDAPVYKDDREGFRFFPPEGWRQTARGRVPAGKIRVERMLVEYKPRTGTKPAALQVSIADLPESAALADYLKSEVYRPQDWEGTGPAESFQINGAPAARVRYRMASGKDPLVRDIVAFRRGERVYFFTGLYLGSDSKTRKAIQAAVDSVVW